MTPKPVAPRASIPAWFLWARREHNLAPEVVLVLLAMCELGDEEWICAQSERNVAQCAGVARSTVQKSLERLLEIRAIADLGRESKRSVRRFRVAAFQPPTAAQVRLLATPAKRRAVNAQGDWIVALPRE